MALPGLPSCPLWAALPSIPGGHSALGILALPGSPLSCRGRGRGLPITMTQGLAGHARRVHR